MKKADGCIPFVNSEGSLIYGSEIAGIALMPEKPSVLLHACCGPCSTSCVERLAPDYAVTVYYYNPNITDREEYYLRRDTLLQFLNAFNEDHKESFTVGYLEGAYDREKYLDKATALADEPEGGKRCDICFAMRLAETARKAAEMEMEYFTTTMSVSPHKNYDKIKELGLMLQEETGVKFLDIDFKKKNGFGRSVELSKKYGLYRQNFCGCDFARYAQNDRQK
ncbi:MAG: epoxyqueuosine reductase QueH [Mogibacterium sp.]|nr:epoxyqueuosine reductase QueH [Mogibacterium sp.]